MSNASRAVVGFVVILTVAISALVLRRGGPIVEEVTSRARIVNETGVSIEFSHAGQVAPAAPGVAPFLRLAPGESNDTTRTSSGPGASASFDFRILAWSDPDHPVEARLEPGEWVVRIRSDESSGDLRIVVEPA